VEIYASLNGALGLDDVELLSAKQIRLTCRRVVLRVVCVSVSVTFATSKVSECLQYYLLANVICYRLSVCLSCVTLVRPTQAI